MMGERSGSVSAFAIVDDTLEDLGLPGPFDIFPTPSEFIHSVGLPTPADFGESLKAKVGAEWQRIRPFRR